MTETDLIPLELFLTVIDDEMAPEAYSCAAKAENLLPHSGSYWQNTL